jgi:hypothetical protein
MGREKLKWQNIDADDLPARALGLDIPVSVLARTDGMKQHTLLGGALFVSLHVSHN